MPDQLWSQDNFTKGELSPFMYARAQVSQYYDGLKTAQNVMTYPTGAAGKRFGTIYQATLSSITAFNQFYFDTYQYLDICVFQLVFSPTNIAVYLEGVLMLNITTTLTGQQVYNMSTTVIGNTYRIAGQGFAPYDLVPGLSSSGITITGISSNAFTIGSASYVSGRIYPVQFTTTGTLPSTTPQILAGVTYFMAANSTSSGIIYPTAPDAKAGTNALTLTTTGAGTNKIFTLDNWTFAHTTFKNLPFYDFNGPITSYDALTFTAAAQSGAVQVITISGAGYAPLDSSYVGGAFIANGGAGRIVSVASATSFNVAVQNAFPITAIQGSLVLLAEPAWSDKRGWPSICSSYQNRALFANTVNLQNGFWASVVNSYGDFGDMTTDDDDAISWFPTSNDVNVIRYIVPYRSITVHTNSGIFSSPLSEIAAITPTSFTLQLQDSTPADVLQPQAIDNQIVIISGNDIHTMLWDGINNAYTSNIVSVVNEQTIRSPVDETTFADLHHAGSRYVFIINANGSMAIYQTLQSENVSGFTPAITEQSYGSSSFLQAANTVDGRCWFVCERQIASAQSAIAISANTSTTLTATASNFSTTEPTAITFTTSGALPTSSPQITTTAYFWAVGVTTDTFMVYTDQADALAATNPIAFTNFGSSSHVVPWIRANIFTLEELTFDVFIDCAVPYNGSAVSTVTTGNLFNAQDVVMVGDGFGFTAQGFNNQVVFNAHGSPVTVTQAYIGYPINLIIEPMPLTPPPGPNNTLMKPKHIRTVRFMFNNTIGGTINGVPIAIVPFDQADIGEPPVPALGIFEMGIFSGWDDFNIPSFTIEHSDPFNIQLLGISYNVDT